MGGAAGQLWRQQDARPSLIHTCSLSLLQTHFSSLPSLRIGWLAHVSIPAPLGVIRRQPPPRSLSSRQPRQSRVRRQSQWRRRPHSTLSTLSHSLNEDGCISIDCGTQTEQHDGSADAAGTSGRAWRLVAHTACAHRSPLSSSERVSIAQHADEPFSELELTWRSRRRSGDWWRQWRWLASTCC